MFKKTTSKIIPALVFSFLAVGAAQAAPLSAQEADQICHKKAVAAAHYIAEDKNKPFLVSFTISPIVEISTVITYQFKFAQSTESLYTVVAYAYPDDRTCTIGSITNNIAGND